MSEELHTLTVYAVQAQQVDMTMIGDKHSRYLNGRITISAHGNGIDYSWQLSDPTQRWWPGDLVQVHVIDSEPTPWPTEIDHPARVWRRS